MSEENDNVNHPSHYCDGRKYEPVEVILDWELDYLLGNAVKYISRCGRKGTPEDAIEDLEKAVWYIQKRIAIMRSCSGSVEPPQDVQPTPVPDDADDILPSYDGDVGSPLKSFTVDTTVPNPAPCDTNLFVVDGAETRLRAI